MCVEEDLESSDYSSEEDTDSIDSFHTLQTEKVARKWAYSILICYTIAAVAFMTIFILWFFKKSGRLAHLDTEYQN
ncbi:LEMD2 [Caenorhabditis elegans]|uniref:LEMD2 n=1 Tax=Caenorhabditis elegans TaxID=6239 RepID=Q564X3_CAEEL|nr:LEMD2 [Caenorhabditis elegans]CAI79234.1 LEMD2 [Caenorhabditis elegans]|eukprot:NP_001024813.1 Uncharacterized protein CELE_M163.9 [Caenorhabditis elegans]